MRKTFFVVMMLFGISLFVQAQGYVDVVYLKNGSIIRGHVIEQVPDEELKIKTYDGSLFIYRMDEVERIVKEGGTFRRRVGRVSNKLDLRGYKGFVDVGYSFANADFDFFEITTTHGYQFNNHIFAGGGIGFQYFSDPDYKIVPIYANFRFNFLNAKVTPYADLRTGGTLGDYEGFYNSISLGVRFTLKNRTAINVAVGYTYQELEYEYHYHRDGWDYYYWDNHENVNALTLKIGVEF